VSELADAAEGLGGRFVGAVEDASRYHAGQLRKGTQIPYLAHLLSVAALVLEDGGSENEAIAALLHDAVEDAGGKPTLEEIRERFGDEVAMIVEACSDTDVVPKPPWRKRKEDYLAHLADEKTPPGVLRVSLADKLHNARAILSDYRRIGDTLWSRFNTKSGGDQVWYYRSLADIFLSRWPGALSRELDHVVSELEWLVATGFDGAVLKKPLVWTQSSDGYWSAVGRTGTEWTISKEADGRYGCTVARWDKPDWYTDSLRDAQQVCDELDQRRPFLPEQGIKEWMPTTDS
jgi:HD domain